MREKWLEQLFEAIQSDDPPYLELLDERWGDLCATPDVASRWADRLMDLVRHVHASRRRGQHAFTRAESACYSALFAAGRHDELIALIGTDPRPMWHDLQWVGRCKVARGEIDEAIEFMTKAVNPWTPMAGLAHFAEGVLLQAGRRTEAYEKYALEANRATTYLATYRLVSKKYPEIDADRLLTDLIATTPGEEGKWFATAKTLKRFDLAAMMAERDVIVSHTTIMRWMLRYAPEYECRWARFSRPPGESWRMDETAVSVRGAQTGISAFKVTIPGAS